MFPFIRLLMGRTVWFMSHESNVSIEPSHLSPNCTFLNCQLRHITTSYKMIKISIPTISRHNFIFLLVYLHHHKLNTPNGLLSVRGENIPETESESLWERVNTCPSHVWILLGFLHERHIHEWNDSTNREQWFTQIGT